MSMACGHGLSELAAKWPELPRRTRASAASKNASPRAAIQFCRAVTSPSRKRKAASTISRPWRTIHMNPGRVSSMACQIARGSSAASGRPSNSPVWVANTATPEASATTTKPSRPEQNSLLPSAHEVGRRPSGKQQQEKRARKKDALSKMNPLGAEQQCGHSTLERETSFSHMRIDGEHPPVRPCRCRAQVAANVARRRRGFEGSTWASWRST